MNDYHAHSNKGAYHRVHFLFANQDVCSLIILGLYYILIFAFNIQAILENTVWCRA